MQEAALASVNVGRPHDIVSAERRPLHRRGPPGYLRIVEEGEVMRRKAKRTE
jgi:hypothetical protein